MQLDAVDFCGARDEGFVWCFSIRRGRKRSGKEKQAEHSQDWKQFKNALHGKLLVLRAHYTRIEAVGLHSRSCWFLFCGVCGDYGEDRGLALGGGGEKRGDAGSVKGNERKLASFYA